MITTSDLKLRTQRRAPWVYRGLLALGHLRPKHRGWLDQQDDLRAESASVDGQVIGYLGGTVVAGGPFEGMTLLDEPGWGNDLSARLLGTYEQEIHPLLEQILAARPRLVVDVGCADGYYLVGLARRLPGVECRGFDVDPKAVERTTRLAKRNDVADQVVLGAECLSKDLIGLPEQTLVICDCEGFERYLLTASVATSNPKSWFIIECHDMITPGVSKLMAKRFAGRRIECVVPTPRLPESQPQLPREIAIAALDEGRSRGGSWLIIR